MVTDIEMDRVINFWRQSIPEEKSPAPWEEHLIDAMESEDSLINKAVDVVKSEQRASSSMLQRRLRIGYPRAARLIDELEQMGIVGPSQTGGKDREVLIPPDDLNNDVDNDNL
jgi:S-DNA-T family DNA segregation ATPase FtsK/SpoIIIE